MNDLTLFCKQLKQGFKPKKAKPDELVRCWSEKDVLNQNVVDTFVIIFRTKGCSWALKSGCTMCGYFNDSMWSKVSSNDLLKQFETAIKKYNGQRFVKIFTSGSFLDEKEIPSNVRKKILKTLFEKAEKISVESRPEYVKNDVLSEIKETIVNSKVFEIGVGLETADDYIRIHNINKGFTFNDYKRSAETIKKFDFKLKTYVLVKPPFLTEKESIKDAIKTVEKIKNITDVVSLNPVNVQRNTVVEFLWQRNSYRPPWLYSVVEVLKESKKIVGDKQVKCDIVGGGSVRGSHNCKNCDSFFLKAISNFSLYQDASVFDDLNCECREKWLDQLELEELGFGSLANMYR